MTILEDRITRVRQHIAEKKIDTLLVLIEENRRYLSGFKGEDHQIDESAGALLISQENLILATDSRFETQAAQEASLFEVVIYKKGLAKELPALVRKLKTAKLGFESSRVSVSQYRSFLKELKNNDSPVELEPLNEMVELLRVVKSEDEILKIQKAIDLAESIFQQVVRKLKPGVTEKQIAWSMEAGMREAGAQALSFPSIIAAGPNSALPHAIPSDRPIREGEPILFDWGAKVNGYCSDASRVIIIGKPDDTFKKAYSTVLEAQKRATDAIKDGVSGTYIDRIARDYIHEQGFAGKFGHNLGHGTGMAVHEAPRLSPQKDDTLKAGMIVTVEPGIYLPQWGGIRLENQVLVTSGGFKVLNKLKESYSIEDYAN
ncbi:MAG: aminopeptidase P family protein [Desulfobacteraceae bacterium]|nr:aminopeptidase P family protein [Desulfobacteraceae bacterium]